MTHPTDAEPTINLHVSAEIDRARKQVEAADDPKVRAAWQHVLEFFESLQPPGVGEPEDE